MFLFAALLLGALVTTGVYAAWPSASPVVWTAYSVGGLFAVLFTLRRTRRFRYRPSGTVSDLKIIFAAWTVSGVLFSAADAKLSFFPTPVRDLAVRLMMLLHPIAAFLKNWLPKPWLLGLLAVAFLLIIALAPHLTIHLTGKIGERINSLMELYAKRVAILQSSAIGCLAFTISAGVGGASLASRHAEMIDAFLQHIHQVSERWAEFEAEIILYSVEEAVKESRAETHPGCEGPAQAHTPGVGSQTSSCDSDSHQVLAIPFETTVRPYSYPISSHTQRDDGSRFPLSPLGGPDDRPPSGGLDLRRPGHRPPGRPRDGAGHGRDGGIAGGLGSGPSRKDGQELFDLLESRRAVWAASPDNRPTGPAVSAQSSPEQEPSRSGERLANQVDASISETSRGVADALRLIDADPRVQVAVEHHLPPGDLTANQIVAARQAFEQEHPTVKDEERLAAVVTAALNVAKYGGSELAKKLVTAIVTTGLPVGDSISELIGILVTDPVSEEAASDAESYVRKRKMESFSHLVETVRQTCRGSLMRLSSLSSLRRGVATEAELQDVSGYLHAELQMLFERAFNFGDAVRPDDIDEAANDLWDHITKTGKPLDIHKLDSVMRDLSAVGNLPAGERFAHLLAYDAYGIDTDRFRKIFDNELEGAIKSALASQRYLEEPTMSKLKDGWRDAVGPAVRGYWLDRHRASIAPVFSALKPFISDDAPKQPPHDVVSQSPPGDDENCWQCVDRWTRIPTSAVFCLPPDQKPHCPHW